eukprot:CAMPEP_0198660586 /NCGR_PEP_ID=MMETSP1467-20131203/37603_1 /TAXON_ID=1462469 /ORGANISM="unid. sp., Strain CCMP2135" /LENGTH=407 /DNA_ID=CAMNT_0044396993 /DNA_START=92 /DNA_END=1311 /DNA_ORIENTATION=+
MKKRRRQLPTSERTNERRNEGRTYLSSVLVEGGAAAQAEEGAVGCAVGGRGRLRVRRLDALLVVLLLLLLWLFLGVCVVTTSGRRLGGLEVGRRRPVARGKVLVGVSAPPPLLDGESGANAAVEEVGEQVVEARAFGGEEEGRGGRCGDEERRGEALEREADEAAQRDAAVAGGNEGAREGQVAHEAAFRGRGRRAEALLLGVAEVSEAAVPAAPGVVRERQSEGLGKPGLRRRALRLVRLALEQQQKVVSLVEHLFRNEVREPGIARQDVQRRVSSVEPRGSEFGDASQAEARRLLFAVLLLGRRRTFTGTFTGRDAPQQLVDVDGSSERVGQGDDFRPAAPGLGLADLRAVLGRRLSLLFRRQRQQLRRLQPLPVAHVQRTVRAILQNVHGGLAEEVALGFQQLA